ncbi:acyl-coenzyme A:6-aminopenicillanic acid acyl-transferase-domain-containing protein [Aspergillus germanicus]
MTIKQIVCSGSPYEIGFTHGIEAAPEIERAIAFYAKLFIKHSRLNWAQVRDLASEFDDLIKVKWPRYYQELQGIADGSKRHLVDILALNVRTEIVFGQFSDGCTSLYYQGSDYAYQGQNWDWSEEQGVNLVQLTIVQTGLPTIKMITEAGLIGKIGLNSNGVGVCFNAIRAKGLDKSRLPVHLGLRVALESRSAMDAVNTLERMGMASSAYILIGDATTAVGLEFTSTTFARVPIHDGFIAHSNHMLLPHANIVEPTWLTDSPVRIETMRDNIAAIGEPLSWETYCRLFADEQHYPCAINRAASADSDVVTLFNIVMDLVAKRAEVRMGRLNPGDMDHKKIVLSFSEL